MQDIVNERVLTLVRGEDGIGISIQGGIDFKCPVKVYKVYENSPGKWRVDLNHETSYITACWRSRMGNTEHLK